MCYFVRDTAQGIFCSYFTEIMSIVCIHQHFCTTSSYRTHKTRQFQVPMPKAQDNKPKKDQQQPLAVPPPRDVYLDENQA